MSTAATTGIESAEILFLAASIAWLIGDIILLYSAAQFFLSSSQFR